MTKRANKKLHRQAMYDQLTWHPSGYGRGMVLAVNVKFYDFNDVDKGDVIEDKYREWWIAQQQEEPTTREVDAAWDRINNASWECVSEQWWEDASEAVKDIDSGGYKVRVHKQPGAHIRPWHGQAPHLDKPFKTMTYANHTGAFTGVQGLGRSGGWCAPEVGHGDLIYEYDVLEWVDRVDGSHNNYDAKYCTDDVMQMVIAMQRIKALMEGVAEWLTNDLEERVDDVIGQAIEQEGQVQSAQG